MDSAEAGVGVEATPVLFTADADTVGIDKSDDVGDSAGVSPSFCFLSASAWRLGGPRRLLGLSYVQGISRLAQDRHGGPLVSHWPRQHAVQYIPRPQIIRRRNPPSPYEYCRHRRPFATWFCGPLYKSHRRLQIRSFPMIRYVELPVMIKEMHGMIT